MFEGSWKKGYVCDLQFYLCFPEGAGIRFNPEGRIVPHSILGSVEDYKTQALKEGVLAKVEFIWLYYDNIKMVSNSESTEFWC